jgi:hypothetical protein
LGNPLAIKIQTSRHREFDGDSDPKTWLRTYSITVQAANGIMT